MSVTLRAYQYLQLSHAANGNSQVFAVLEPSRKDEYERQDKMLDELEQMDELVAIGLLKEVTAEFDEQIKVCRFNHGRGYRVFAITEQGKLMFRFNQTRSIN